MIDHISIAVAGLEKSRAFYAAALAPLGVGIGNAGEQLRQHASKVAGANMSLGLVRHHNSKRLLPNKPIVVDQPGSVAFGRFGGAHLWLNRSGLPASGLDLAFIAEKRADVRALYHAAIAAGGADNGPPGLRPQYNPDYYGALVRDPDGHNIEAVCRNPED